MAAARWHQHGGCGGFTGTIRECADAHALECQQGVNVRIFIIVQGRRDDSADGIIIIGSNGGACGDVHRGRQCAAAANNDATDNNTADTDADADADDIVC